MSEHLQNPKFLKIIAGKSDLDGDEFDPNNVHCASQVNQADLIIKHPLYKSAGTGNDVALIKTRDAFWINSVSLIQNRFYDDLILPNFLQLYPVFRQFLSNFPLFCPIFA